MPRQQRFIVELSRQDREFLLDVIKRDCGPRRKILHARILLLADQGESGKAWLDTRISATLSVSAKTVSRVRERFAELGLPDAIERREHRNYKPRRLDPEATERLLELAQGEPPDGHQRWTLRLLADQLVRLKIVDEISHETVRRQLRNARPSLNGRGHAHHQPAFPT